MKKFLKRLAVGLAIATTALASPSDVQRQGEPFNNLLIDNNPGFENGLARWTASGGTFAKTTTATHVAKGVAAASWDASANAQTLTSKRASVPAGLYGGACVATAWLKDGDANLTMQVIDGSNVVLASQVLATGGYTLYSRISVPFTCPSGGGNTVAIRFLATANANQVYIDDVFIGQKDTLGGPVVESWKQYTPSFNGITATGASTSVYYRRISDSIQLRGNVKIATVGAGGFEMSLPNGWTVDTTKLNFVNNSSHFGYYQRLDGSNWNPITTGGAMGEVFYNTGAAAGYLSFGPITSGSANEYLPTASNSVFGAGEDVVFDNVTIPISQIAGTGTFNAFTQDNLYDWNTYTPLWTGQSGSPAIGNGTLTGKWRRVGDEMEINIAVVWGGSTVDGSGTYCWTLPDGYDIDYSKISHISSYRGNFGYLHSLQASNQALWIIGKCDYAGDHYVSAVTSSGTPATIQGATFDYLSLNFKVPVVQFTNNHNALVGFTDATPANSGLVNPYSVVPSAPISSGTYTPVFTLNTNLDAVTNAAAMWMKIGNVVFVYGKADFDATATGNANTDMSLPLASNLATSNDLSGHGTQSGTTSSNAQFYGDATNDVAEIAYNASQTSPNTMEFSFMYVIK